MFKALHLYKCKYKYPKYSLQLDEDMHHVVERKKQQPIRDWSLITGNGGAATKREGGM